MIENKYFPDNIARAFVPYKGFCQVLEDGSEIIDTMTKDSEGPFEIVSEYPEDSSSHLLYNLRDKDGNLLLPKNIRKISFYDEGYYLLEDNNEDELIARDGVGGFLANDYKSEMNVMRADGTLLSEEWFLSVIPDIGFVRVCNKNKRWFNLLLSGHPFIHDTYKLKFGCSIIREKNGYVILNSFHERITDSMESVMWADKGLWCVNLLCNGTYHSFLHGQGEEIISYAHEILIRNNIIALIEMEGTWYAFDSLGKLIKCFNWNIKF